MFSRFCVVPLILLANFVSAQDGVTTSGFSVPTEYSALGPLLSSMEQQILALQSEVGKGSSSSSPTSTGSSPASTSSLPPKASTAVTVGNETMLVGQLTGSNLNSSIISALTGICTESGCDSTVGAASIPNINYAVAGLHSIQTGTLEMTISSSHYTGIAERDAMINLIASSLTLTATNSNCKEISYTQGCGVPRRRTDGQLVDRAIGPGGLGGSGGSCETHTVNTCSGSNNIGVQIVDTANENALLGIMDFSATFAGSVVPFDCGDFIDSITSWLAPFKEAADIVSALGDVSAACGDVSAAAGVVGGST